MRRLRDRETGKWGDNQTKPSIMRYIGKKSVAKLFPSPSLHVPYSQLPITHYQLPITLHKLFNKIGINFATEKFRGF